MTITRVHDLSQMPKNKWLKPVSHKMTLKQAKALARDKTRTVYYYKRRYSHMPPLLFEQKILDTESTTVSKPLSEVNNVSQPVQIPLPLPQGS